MYRHALELEPDHLGILNNFGNALRSVSQFRDAISAYEKALQKAPEHPLILKTSDSATSMKTNPRKHSNTYAEPENYPQKPDLPVV